MGTTADKLAYLNDTKTAIKNAIVAKGVAVPDGTTFRAYADKIADIQDVSSLPTQGAETVTPTTSEQIAVASGTYTTGDVKVAGDANLVAENIAEGVSIFGVTGTHSGGGELVTVDISEIGSATVYDYQGNLYASSDGSFQTLIDAGIYFKNVSALIQTSGVQAVQISGGYVVVHGDCAFKVL